MTGNTPYSDAVLIPPTSTSLNEVSQEVLYDEITSDEIQALIDRMLLIGQGEQGNPERPTLVGLAAPQIGINKRVILVGIDAEGNGSTPHLEAFINPVITYRSPGQLANREGCYSTGRICGIVDRAQAVHVRGFDRFGNEVDLSAQNFPARIFQHEIDHLDGIRFPDHITNPLHLHWVPAEQFSDYRKQWASWTQYCDPARWQAMKHGHVDQTRPHELHI
jgi:peptide deformylase